MDLDRLLFTEQNIGAAPTVNSTATDVEVPVSWGKASGPVGYHLFFLHFHHAECDVISHL